MLEFGTRRKQTPRIPFLVPDPHGPENLLESPINIYRLGQVRLGQGVVMLTQILPLWSVKTKKKFQVRAQVSVVLRAKWIG